MTYNPDSKNPALDLLEERRRKAATEAKRAMSTMQCVCGAEAEEGTEGWEWRRDGEYRHGMRYCPDCAEKDRTRGPTLAELDPGDPADAAELTRRAREAEGR